MNDIPVTAVVRLAFFPSVDHRNGYKDRREFFKAEGERGGRVVAFESTSVSTEGIDFGAGKGDNAIFSTTDALSVAITECVIAHGDKTLARRHWPGDAALIEVPAHENHELDWVRGGKALGGTQNTMEWKSTDLKTTPFGRQPAHVVPSMKFRFKDLDQSDPEQLDIHTRVMDTVLKIAALKKANEPVPTVYDRPEEGPQ